MLEQYETNISIRNMEQIRNRAMTPSEMIDFLENGAMYRSFPDLLRSVYPGEDLAERLRSGLQASAGKTLSKKESDALRKSISNWLKGDVVPQNREQLFKICFALGLSESASSRVLARACETGIHYRNPRELVYAFALRTGLSYPEAVSLDQEMSVIYQPIVENASAKRAAQWKEKEKLYRTRRAEARQQHLDSCKKGVWTEAYIGTFAEEDPPSFLTQQVAHRFAEVRTKEELRHFFLETGAELGSIHESAYEKFWKLLLTLQEPDDTIVSDPENDSSVYSLERIERDYFRMHVPIGKDTRSLDYLQKAIKKNWPGVTELQKMKARKIDVSRKALLLLFLITEDFLSSDDLQYSDQAAEEAAWYIPGEDESPRDQLEIVLNKINLFLETYGMNQLDPGNPFDCLVLYALAAGYEDAFLSDNFEQALSALFPFEEGT